MNVCERESLRLMGQPHEATATIQTREKEAAQILWVVRGCSLVTSHLWGLPKLVPSQSQRDSKSMKSIMTMNFFPLQVSLHQPSSLDHSISTENLNGKASKEGSPLSSQYRVKEAPAECSMKYQQGNCVIYPLKV